jgi:hypothetical protein
MPFIQWLLKFGLSCLPNGNPHPKPSFCQMAPKPAKLNQRILFEKPGGERGSEPEYFRKFAG